jgi:hypothetical protein
VLLRSVRIGAVRVLRETRRCDRTRTGDQELDEIKETFPADAPVVAAFMRSA